MATVVTAKPAKVALPKKSLAAQKVETKQKAAAKLIKSPDVVLATAPVSPGVAKVEKIALTTPSLRPASAGDAFRKKDLIDKVTAITGANKSTVRNIVEATLVALGDALTNGAMLNLPPLGKAKVSRAAEAGSGKAMTIKLRRPTSAGAGKAQTNHALADDDE